MIDFVRARIVNRSELVDLLCDPIEFPETSTNLKLHSSEIGSFLKANYYNMEFRVTEKYAFVQNSLHVFNNEFLHNKSTNYNDFSFFELRNSLEKLEKKVSGVFDAEITQLEFGFNFYTSMPPSNIIKNNILMHDFNGHSVDRLMEHSSSLKRFDYHNYQVKVYDKGQQNKLSNNLMRYEVRFIRTPELRKLNIVKIADLKNRANLQNVFEYSMKRFDSLIIVDSIPFDYSISADEKSLITQYRSSDFWNTQKDRDLRNQKSKHKLRFNELLHKHNLLTIKTELRNSLNQKFQMLIN